MGGLVGALERECWTTNTTNTHTMYTHLLPPTPIHPHTPVVDTVVCNLANRKFAANVGWLDKLICLFP